MSITNWPKAERPREKLLSRGAAALSDAELLAILITTGAQGKTAIDLSLELLSKFNGIAGILTTPKNQLQTVRGLGDAKYASLQAIKELSRRSMLDTLQQQGSLICPNATRDYLCTVLAHEQREVFWALFLNNQHQIIASEALAYGTIDCASIYPREVLKACLNHNAAAVIFAHNHPSGSLEASEADKSITYTLKKALATIDIRVLDHFIIGNNKSSSMVEMGLL